MLQGSETGRFEKRLRTRETLLLDGGLATRLRAQGCNIDSSLWSASVLQSQPDQIVAAHRAFLAAGADCIETVTYQASREGFESVGVSQRNADALMNLSVELAESARDAEESDALIAASLGPYGAILHDGSEYRGDYRIGDNRLRNFHRERIELFSDTAADVIALETIPSFLEAQILADVLSSSEKPAWVAFSCRDGRSICDGTAVEKAAAIFRDHPRVVAVGINCTAPQYIEELIGRIAAAVPDKAVVVYPNSGETWNAAAGRWEGIAEPVDLAAAAVRWLAAGARLVGGCCRTTPAHIAAMRVALDQNRRNPPR